MPLLQARKLAFCRQRLALAAQVGRLAGELLWSGLVNRDHKLSDLIPDPACEKEGRKPVIIDPPGIGRLQNTRQIYKILAMMIRTTHRAGYFITRKELTCLKALLYEHRFSDERPMNIERTARQLVQHSRSASTGSSAEPTLS